MGTAAIPSSLLLHYQSHQPYRLLLSGCHYRRPFPVSRRHPTAPSAASAPPPPLFPTLDANNVWLLMEVSASPRLYVRIKSATACHRRLLLGANSGLIRPGAPVDYVELTVLQLILIVHVHHTVIRLHGFPCLRGRHHATASNQRPSLQDPPLEQCRPLFLARVTFLQFRCPLFTSRLSLHPFPSSELLTFSCSLGISFPQSTLVITYRDNTAARPHKCSWRCSSHSHAVQSNRLPFWRASPHVEHCRSLNSG